MWLPELLESLPKVGPAISIPSKRIQTFRPDWGIEPGSSHLSPASLMVAETVSRRVQNHPFVWTESFVQPEREKFSLLGFVHKYRHIFMWELMTFKFICDSLRLSSTETIK